MLGRRGRAPRGAQNLGGAAAEPTGSTGPEPANQIPVSGASLASIACSLPHEWLLRTWRGNSEDRSAEIQILPIEPNFVGSGLPHVGPWPYAQDIPMFWYGPGHIAPAGVVDRPVTLAGIAPTQAQLLGFPFRAIDGSPMTEAIAGNQTPPRLLVTMVWDAGGRNVLERWKNDWPYLRSLIPQGAWYEHATVGTSPTSTAQTHATIGTGAFPDAHLIVAHRLRIGADLTTPWAKGPAYLMEPTLADLYDRAMGNGPVVGEIGTVSIHLGMLGHGAMWGGGDQDIAVIRERIGADTLGAEGSDWNLTPELMPYYRFPDYLNRVGGFARDVRAVDANDGQIDGRWRTNDIETLLQGFDTPARIPYQTRVIEEMIRREGFGADETPDLLFVNYKMIDYISHVWTVNSPEMQDAVEGQDAALETFVDFLNATVGQGQWAMVLTADHGSIPDPKVTGAFQIAATPIQNGINAAFDTDGDETHIVQLIQPTQIFVERGRAPAERSHARGGLRVDPRADEGRDRAARRHGPGRPGRRPRVPGGLPVQDDGPPPLPARGARMRRLALLVAVAVLAAACTSDTATEVPSTGTTPSGSSETTAEPVAPPTPGALADAACAIPHRQLVRIWRGTDPERSGQIVFVPQEPNFVGTNFPHSGPWDYLQDVPLFWYGPGIIPALGGVERPVTLADVAPTQAELLHFGFDAPDGKAIPEIAPDRHPAAADRHARVGRRRPERPRRVPERLAGAALDDPEGDLVRPRERGVLAVDHAGHPRDARDGRVPDAHGSDRRRVPPRRRPGPRGCARTGAADGADARRPLRPRHGQRAARGCARERDLAPQHGEPRIAVGRRRPRHRGAARADPGGQRGRRGHDVEPPGHVPAVLRAPRLRERPARPVRVHGCDRSAGRRARRQVARQLDRAVRGGMGDAGPDPVPGHG